MGAGLAARAGIVLLAGGHAERGDRPAGGGEPPTVNAWRTRYAERGLAGLAEENGRQEAVDGSASDSGGDVAAAAGEPGSHALVVALLANRLGTSHVTIAEAWKRYGVKPWKAETYRFYTDPELEAKVTDVIGLYVAPPENAIVLCATRSPRFRR